MSILDMIQKVEPQAPRITLYGVPGVGKSTLANEFPDALFILTEENNVVGCEAFPVCKTLDQLREIIKQLRELDVIPYKTIVIDSISKLDQLIIANVIATSPPGKRGETVSTIAAAYGGYGAGFLKAASLHRAFKAQMDALAKRGITIIFISHIEIKNCKRPDQEDYHVYTLVMNGDASRAVYIDDVDMVGFCKMKSMTVETESGRNLIKSLGYRTISVGITEVHASKNRFSMPDEIPMTFADIEKYIPFYTNKKEVTL